MSWAVGNLFGTTLATLPFRGTVESCGPASQSSGSQSSGSGLLTGEATTEHYRKTLWEAAQRVEALQAEGYQARAIKRAQDRLAPLDPAKVHGYVVLLLRRGREERHFRIDWGQHGVWRQEDEHPSNLMSYLEQQTQFAAYRAAAVTAAGVGVGALGAVAAAESSAAAAVAAEAGAVATGATALSASAIAAVLAGAAAVVIGGIAVSAEIGKWAEVYEPVRDPRTALHELHLLLASFSDSKAFYSLSYWNCNHFANCIMQTLAPPSDSTWQESLPDLSGGAAHIAAMLPNMSEMASGAAAYLPDMSSVSKLSQAWPSTPWPQEETAASTRDQGSRRTSAGGAACSV